MTEETIDATSAVAADEEATVEVEDSGAQATDAANSETGPVSYDFARPWTISGKFKSSMEAICESYANQVGFSISNYIRNNVDMSFDNVKQSLFKDYVANLPDSKCIGVFSFEPIAGQCIYTVEGKIIFALLEKLTGGPATDAVELDREFSEVEMRIFKVIMQKLVLEFRPATDKYFESVAELSRVETNPAFIGVMTGGERIVELDFTLKLGEIEGGVKVSIPMAGFDSVMATLDPNEDASMESVVVPPEDTLKIAATLTDSSVEAVAELGKSTITLDRLMRLEVGDTLVLAHRMSDPIPLRVGNTVVCVGEPGKSQSNRALRVTSSIATEE